MRMNEQDLLVAFFPFVNFLKSLVHTHYTFVVVVVIVRAVVVGASLMFSSQISPIFFVALIYASISGFAMLIVPFVTSKL